MDIALWKIGKEKYASIGFCFGPHKMKGRTIICPT